MLAIGQCHGRHNLMRFARQFAQHCCGVGSVVRFFQHFAIKDNDGIRTQYRQIARCQRYTSLRFFARQTGNVLLRTFLRVPLFFNPRDQSFKRNTKLSEQLLTTWRT